MRIHLKRDIIAIWHTLPPEVRVFVEALKRNPHPTEAYAITERPGYYEDFIAGYWLGWQVDDSGNETIIRVTISQQL